MEKIQTKYGQSTEQEAVVGHIISLFRYIESHLCSDSIRPWYSAGNSVIFALIGLSPQLIVSEMLG